MDLKRKPLSAAALAGGKSSRMGTDKALLPLAEGGPSMLALVLDSLSVVADEVFVVANDQERYGRFGVPVVKDVHPDSGALGGIHTAIQSSTYEHCLVVACDMPFLNTDLLRHMADESRDYDVLVPLVPGQSRQRGDGLVFQTLHAIYSKRCLSLIDERILAGKRQVVGFFEDARVRTIGVAEIARWDPGLRSFFNANSPEALSIAAELSASVELDHGSGRFQGKRTPNIRQMTARNGKQ